MFGDDWSYKDPWAFKNIRNVDYRFVTIHAGMAKNYPEMKRLDLRWLKKQGRIYGNPVADGWAGAVMRKPLGIQKCDGPTDLPTYQLTRQGVESRIRD